MKTSLYDKAVAVAVVATAYLALVVLWAPRLDGATTPPATTSAPRDAAAQRLSLTSPDCGVEELAVIGTIQPEVPAPARHPEGLWL